MNLTPWMMDLTEREPMPCRVELQPDRHKKEIINARNPKDQTFGRFEGKLPRMVGFVGHVPVKECTVTFKAGGQIVRDTGALDGARLVCVGMSKDVGHFDYGTGRYEFMWPRMPSWYDVITVEYDWIE